MLQFPMRAKILNTLLFLRTHAENRVFKDTLQDTYFALYHNEQMVSLDAELFEMEKCGLIASDLHHGKILCFWILERGIVKFDNYVNELDELTKLLH